MLTIVIPFYNNYQALSKVTPILKKLPCKIIIVDDGSKIPLKLDWAHVIRIDKDIPWNQPQANNIGIMAANTPYILRLDIDHWITNNEYQQIKELCKNMEPSTFYKFPRIVDSTTKKHAAPNILLMRKTDFIAVGMYNEQFCGNYGHDDSEFRYRAQKKGFQFKESKITVFTTELPTKHLNRDTTVNKRLFESLK